jgi:K+-transporting ATPase ATPase C chain
MVSQLRPAITLIAIFTLLTGVLMPLGFVGFGKLVMPYQAGGSLIVQNGKVVGSAIIGQNFTSDKYFHGRPSALMGTDPKDSTKQVATPYDASESGASNLAPTSKALVDRVTGDVKAFHGASVPADAVTTSASGLDPHISPENAALQIERVAKARNLSPDAVKRLVDAHTEAPFLGVLGAPRVNVLAINLALDAQSGGAVARN